MTGVEHSDWLHGHAHYHHSLTDAGSSDPSIASAAPTNPGHIDSVASVLKTVWLNEPPALTVGSTALTVNEGGSIALPISVAPTSSHGATTVTIGGLASYETITDHLDHTVFTASPSSGSVTLTAAEVNSGLTLTSNYSGPDKPQNTLTVSASETAGYQTLTAAPQTIVVTDPPASGAASAGTNALTLQVSGDNYNGDPQIEVFVDGTQVGSSSYTITADHSSGQWQTITIDGNFDPTVTHQVQVEFVNDGWSGTYWWASGASADGNDVNAYVESISLNGVTLEGSQAATNTGTNGIVTIADPNTAAMDINGALSFNAAAEPASTSVVTGSAGGGVPAGNPLTLQVSGDNYNGDPQIEVFVDGAQVGSSSYTITADHSSGQWQTITIDGNFDPTVAHQVQVEFVNDGWSGTYWWASGASADGNDVNAYVESISLNGVTLEGSQAATNTGTNGVVTVADPNTAAMDTNGALAFNVAADGPGGSSADAGGTDPGAGFGAVPSGPGYYVSPNGNDGNPGTLAAPFATLAHAQAAMEGSSIKTTYVEAGTYNLSSTLTLTAADNGEHWNYYPPNGVDTAILNAGSTAPGNGLYDAILIQGGSNITINGLTIEHFQANGVDIEGGSSFNVPVASGNAVVNCNIGYNTLTQWNAAAVFTQDGAPNTLIENNYVHDLGSMGIDVNAYTPNGDTSINGTVIAGNVVLNTVERMSDSGAIYVGMHSGSQSHVLIENNYVANYSGPGTGGGNGIYLDDHASNVTVTGNVIGPPGAAGAQGQYDGDAAISVDGGHNVITNNIVDLGSTGQVWTVLGWYDFSNPSQVDHSGDQFTNNIVVSSYSGSQWTAFSQVGGMSFYSNTTASDWTIANNIYYNYAGGQVNTSGNLVGDTNPVFENPRLSGLFYQIASGSPVHNVPVSFHPLAGGWGPQGFVIPASALSPSD